jgi:hypothetical protein
VTTLEIVDVVIGAVVEVIAVGGIAVGGIVVVAPVVAVAVTYPSAQLAEETAIVGVSAGTFVAAVVTEVVVTFVAVVTSVVAAEEMVGVDAGVEDAVEL